MILSEFHAVLRQATAFYRKVAMLRSIALLDWLMDGILLSRTSQNLNPAL